MAHIVLIPTPVGNLEDITLRALRFLKEANLVAAEDTRTTGILLKHFDISVPMVSIHQHNEHHKVPRILDQVQEEDLLLAVCSDAGTPGISDPGFLMVREAVQRGIKVEVLPGPTAFIPALVGSGLPCDRFVFEGFLPPKKGRQTKLKQLATETRTLVLYESPHRLGKSLRDLAEYLGEERPAVVAREISKVFETFHRGTLSSLIAEFEERPAKGELVLILGGAENQG